MSERSVRQPRNPKPRKLWVVFKLDRANAAQVRWIAAEGMPAQGYSGRLLGITPRDGGGPIELSGANMAPVTLPVLHQGADRYEFFCMGTLEIPPDSPDHARLAGKKNLEADFTFGFFNAEGEWAAEGRDYTILSQKPALISGMGKPI